MPLIAQAQTPRILSLEECRNEAIANNAKVKMADGKMEQAEEVKKAAFTKYFPTIEASGIAVKTSRPVIDYNVLDIITIEMIRKGTSAGVYAIQPVFAGGRIVNGNKLAAVGAEASKLERESTVQEVMVTAEQYYWDIVTLKAKQSTLVSVLQMVDTLQQQVSAAVDAGVTLRNDLLRVQLVRNDLEATLVDLDNGIILSRQLLAQYIGHDGEDIDVEGDANPDSMPSFPSDLFISPKQALPTTVDYQLLQQEVKATELEHRISVGNNMPTVGVGAGWFYDRLLSESNNFGAVFVSVCVPISGWWGGSHSMKKSKIAVENARTNLDDLSQMLCIKMTDAWDNLTAAHRKMSIAKESIAQATENLRLNRNYYDAGIVTITDLLEAQTLYRQSLDQYASAYGSFRTAQAAYLRATGRL